MKKIVSLALALACLLTLSACGGEETAQGNSESYNISVAHVLSTDSSYQDTCNKFAELVAEYTNGAVTATVYPAGQLGNERELFEGVQMGTVDTCYAATTILATWCDLCNYLDVPFMFDSYEEEQRVLEGEFGEMLAAQIAEQGMTVMGYGETGFGNFMYNGDSIVHPSDIHGQTMRCKSTEIDQAFYSTMGLNPVALAWGEIFTGLQTGVIEGLSAPMNSSVATQFHTVTDKITIVDACLTATTFVIGQPTLDKIPVEYHEAILQAGKDACAYNWEIIPSWDEKAFTAIEESGSEIIYVDRNEWVDAFKDKMWTKLSDMGLIKDDVLAVIDSSR